MLDEARSTSPGTSATTPLLARWRRFAVPLALLAAGVLLPPFLSTYNLTILTQVLIFGVFAMSLDLLVGYTGMISLGHAAFFGLGAYAAGYVAVHWTPNALATILAALVAAGLGALVIGYLSIRARGVYFLMITLAFAQMIYSLAIKLESITGGSDGLAGIPRPTLGFDSGLLWQGLPFYYYVLAGFVIVSVLLTRLVHSPFGRVLIGIRENEARMRAIGYDTQRLKLVAFVIAGIFAGYAGALFSAYQGIAAPGDIYWGTSGNVLIMVIMGGAGTLSGPVLGAATFLLLQHLVSSATERWQLIAGAVFIFFVLALRGGLISLFRSKSEGGWRPWEAIGAPLKQSRSQDNPSARIGEGRE
ncbi:MAG: branched-chain amino acid ABC transporter permease [Ardenticatenaceae bacterium]|nr:branched-chain amino acid ABC transporter permease [Ardenticatenaceae bacterium]HBY96625.1 branched-chain amino acid ABC transporter permease [Chloroflexota bacterium]